MSQVFSCMSSSAAEVHGKNALLRQCPFLRTAVAQCVSLILSAWPRRLVRPSTLLWVLFLAYLKALLFVLSCLYFAHVLCYCEACLNCSSVWDFLSLIHKNNVCFLQSPSVSIRDPDVLSSPVMCEHFIIFLF